MNGWDAEDNKTQSLYKNAKICSECGVLSNCVSDEGFEDHPDSRAIVCNHCYGILTDNNECSSQIAEGSSTCDGCIHLGHHRDSMDCEDYSSCFLCPNQSECPDYGSK